MRNLVIVAGLLLGAALLPAAPAQAAIGCQCVKLGAPSICTATVTDCNFKYGGLCAAPCDYQPAKKATKASMKKKKK